MRMQTIFLLLEWKKFIPQGQLTTLTGDEIDYSKGEEAKVGILERACKFNKKVSSCQNQAHFQNGMGVLATLRHHKDFVDALKDEPFVDELKKSLEKRTRSWYSRAMASTFKHVSAQFFI